MSTVSLQGRSILDLESLSPAEIHRILDMAGQMKHEAPLNLPVNIWELMSSI